MKNGYIYRNEQGATKSTIFFSSDEALPFFAVVSNPQKGYDAEGEFKTEDEALEFIRASR